MTKKIACLFSILFVSLSACSSQLVDTTNLNQLQNMTPRNLPQDQLFNVSSIRLKAVKETAESLGAQAGLAAQAKYIDTSLAQESNHMDSAFNFDGLMLKNSVLPPVLVQSDQSISVDGPDTLRLSDHTYQIEQQAQFVTAPPTWRTYLWMNYDKPKPPDALLLPKSSKEREIWKAAILDGWKKGIAQANEIDQENVAKLARDFNGMLLYRELLAKGMVTEPFVSKEDLGVTGGGDQMQINDRVLRISAKPKLQTDSQNWKPLIVIDSSQGTS